jgi:hypothetical protein
MAAPSAMLQPEKSRGYDPASQSIAPQDLVPRTRYRLELRREFVEPTREGIRTMFRTQFAGTPQAVIDAAVEDIGHPMEGAFVELIGADHDVPLFTDIARPNHLRGEQMAFPPHKYYFFPTGKRNTNQYVTEALGRQKVPTEVAGKIAELLGSTNPYRGFKDSTTGTGTGVSVPRLLPAPPGAGAGPAGSGRRTKKSKRRARKTRRRHR